MRCMMALGDLPVRRYFGPLFAIGGHGGQDLFVVTLSAGLEVGVVWIEKLPGGDDAQLSLPFLLFLCNCLNDSTKTTSLHT